MTEETWLALIAAVTGHGPVPVNPLEVMTGEHQ
jgi:hypothetical protein